jgi:hypothetical protein
LLLAGGAIGSANAAQVTYNFAGVVDYVSFANPIDVGALMTGSVTYDTSVVPDFGSNGGNASWWSTGAMTALHVTIGGRSGSSASGAVSTYNQTFYGAFPTHDQFVTWTGFSGPAVDNLLSPVSFEIFLESFLNDAAVSDALNLAAPLSLAIFETSQFGGSFGGVDPILGGYVGSRFVGHFTEFSAATSQTPLPAALPLFASGLGALGLFAYRRKRKAA